MLRNEAYVGVIVYGRDNFVRDLETGNRVSRPAEVDNIVHRDRPELQIVDDELWNSVQIVWRRPTKSTRKMRPTPAH